ncbi:MAG TPA: hypothetical protein DD417_14280 [Elusimicrobia bacterium]|nr:hypothetical protein [Elusimicrobiota bacterium]
MKLFHLSHRATRSGSKGEVVVAPPLVFTSPPEVRLPSVIPEMGSPFSPTSAVSWGFASFTTWLVVDVVFLLSSTSWQIMSSRSLSTIPFFVSHSSMAGFFFVRQSTTCFLIS